MNHCPNCKARDKIVKRCRLCYVYSCSECSVHELCIDCFVSGRGKEEIAVYFEDKHLEEVVYS